MSITNIPLTMNNMGENIIDLICNSCSCNEQEAQEYLDDEVRNLQELKELGVEAKLDHTDISSVGGAKADIILSGKNFEKQFERYTLDCPTIFLDRLVDKNEIKEKLTPVLKDLGVL